MYVYSLHISAVFWLNEIAVSSYMMLCMGEPCCNSSQLELVSFLLLCVEHPLSAFIVHASSPGKYLRFETGDHKHAYIYWTIILSHYFFKFNKTSSAIVQLSLRHQLKICAVQEKLLIALGFCSLNVMHCPLWLVGLVCIKVVAKLKAKWLLLEIGALFLKNRSNSDVLSGCASNSHYFIAFMFLNSG